MSHLLKVVVEVVAEEAASSRLWECRLHTLMHTFAIWHQLHYLVLLNKGFETGLQQREKLLLWAWTEERYKVASEK